MSGEPIFLLQRHFKIHFSTNISYMVPKKYFLYLCVDVVTNGDLHLNLRRLI